MSNDEKKKEVKAPKKGIIFCALTNRCTWTNRGSKISPALFTVGCNGQNINVVKMMRKKGQFIDKCPFCGLTVNWQGHKK